LFYDDGYVGNEETSSPKFKIQNCSRFQLGIGSSGQSFSARYKMAEEGRGEVEYVALEDDGSKARGNFTSAYARRFLTDIPSNGTVLPVADVYPNRIADLFSAKPVILHGRYTKAASGTIKLAAKSVGRYAREIRSFSRKRKQKRRSGDALGAYPNR
jgi:hypothetical protein